MIRALLAAALLVTAAQAQAQITLGVGLAMSEQSPVSNPKNTLFYPPAAGVTVKPSPISNPAAAVQSVSTTSRLAVTVRLDHGSLAGLSVAAYQRAGGGFDGWAAWEFAGAAIEGATPSVLVGAHLGKDGRVAPLVMPQVTARLADGWSASVSIQAFDTRDLKPSVWLQIKHALSF